MKRTIITTVCLLFLTLTAASQDLVGIWTTGEQYDEKEKSIQAIYYVFGDNGQATAIWTNRYADDNPLLSRIGDLRIYTEMQGHYYVEGGKGLTVNFDRSTAKVSNNYIPKEGLDAQTVSTMKARLDQVFAQQKDMIVALMPLSLLAQIVYFNGNCMSLRVYQSDIRYYTRVENIKK